jgi:hypothetical protein
VLVCTGYHKTIRDKNAGDLGIREFLMKPLTRNELVEAIRRHL